MWTIADSGSFGRFSQDSSQGPKPLTLNPKPPGSRGCQHREHGHCLYGAGLRRWQNIRGPFVFLGGVHDTKGLLL